MFTLSARRSGLNLVSQLFMTDSVALLVVARKMWFLWRRLSLNCVWF